jgi:GcrA cell cycle regulator
VSTLHERIREVIRHQSGGNALTVARIVGCDVATVHREAARMRAGEPPGGTKFAPPRPRTADWCPDEKLDRLKELWADGASASDIAREFGTTRNAVLGKVHRMGLSGRVVPRRTVSQRKPSPRLRPILRYGNTALGRLYLVPAPAQPFQELDIPLAERKTVPTLEDKDCRWPIGDPQHPDFHFCGRPKIAGLPYCDHHSRVAFQPPQTYRRAPPADRIPTYADAEKEDVACGS